MKKVVMTVIGVLAIAGSANAQLLGTWYTDEALWTSLITNTISTANFNPVDPSGSGHTHVEAGITATVPATSTYLSFFGNFGSDGSSLGTNGDVPVTFAFGSNAFAGYFGHWDAFGQPMQKAMTFNIDESLTERYTLTSTTAGFGFSFLGYISNSTSDINVKVTGNSSADKFMIDSFSFGTGTNPASANIAPEPGTLALALTGGCALVGMCIRRRRISN
jgi:hypothetical protein